MATKILIVEDELAQALALESTLRAEGFQVVRARSGEDALEQIAAAPPDLVLLDIILPGITGLEVSQQVRETLATKDLPVILVTASQMRGLDRSSKTFGVTACLTKPYTRTELLGAIRAALPSPAP